MKVNGMISLVRLVDLFELTPTKVLDLGFILKHSRLLLQQDAASPLSPFILLVVEVVGSSAVPEVGLVLSFEPVASIGPVVFAVAVHHAFRESADVVRIIRILHGSFAFDFVDVVLLLDFSLVTYAVSQLHFYIQGVLEKVLLLLTSGLVHKCYAAVPPLFVQLHFCIEFWQASDPISFQRDAFLAQEKFSIPRSFVIIDSPLVQKFIGPYDFSLTFGPSLNNLSFIIKPLRRKNDAFARFYFIVVPATLDILLVLGFELSAFVDVLLLLDGSEIRQIVRGCEGLAVLSEFFELVALVMAAVY